MQNSKGPKTDPCGTPESTGRQLDNPLQHRLPAAFHRDSLLSTALNKETSISKDWCQLLATDESAPTVDFPSL